MGIKKCEIYHADINDFSLEKFGNNSKISISSIVEIRNKRINLAISEAKLKAKKKLVKFLINENFDNQIISRFSNNSFNFDLSGVIVDQICIQNGEFLKLYLVIDYKSINTLNKNNDLRNK